MKLIITLKLDNSFKNMSDDEIEDYFREDTHELLYHAEFKIIRDDEEAKEMREGK